MTPFRALTPSTQPQFVMGQRIVDSHDLPVLGGIDIRAAARYLKDAGVAPDHENCWHAYIHPDVEHDLYGDETIVEIVLDQLKPEEAENPLLAQPIPVIYAMKFHSWMEDDTEVPVGPYNVYTGSSMELNRGQIYRTAFGITPA